VVCDRLYGGRAVLTELELMPRDQKGQDPSAITAADRPILERQALHAHRLMINHPTTGERMVFVAEMPDDMASTLKAMRRWRAK
jgi:23S rRNA pseudouridine1911/1915/1917 synthase